MASTFLRTAAILSAVCPKSKVVKVRNVRRKSLVFIEVLELLGMLKCLVHWILSDLCENYFLISKMINPVHQIPQKSLKHVFGIFITRKKIKKYFKKNYWKVC